MDLHQFAHPLVVPVTHVRVVCLQHVPLQQLQQRVYLAVVLDIRYRNSLPAKERLALQLVVQTLQKQIKKFLFLFFNILLGGLPLPKALRVHQHPSESGRGGSHPRLEPTEVLVYLTPHHLRVQLVLHPLILHRQVKHNMVAPPQDLVRLFSYHRNLPTRVMIQVRLLLVLLRKCINFLKFKLNLTQRTNGH